jgi:hypothetical protein
MKGNDDIHQRLTRGRARFKHGGDVGSEIRVCQFWSLVFMQGFDVESKTFGISSSSTLTRP